MLKQLIEQLTSKKLLSFGGGAGGVVAIAGMIAAGTLALWPGMILATFVTGLSGLHIWRQSLVDVEKIRAGVPLSVEAIESAAAESSKGLTP